jgi:carbonic anhydrase
MIAVEKVINKAIQENITPQQAIDLLKSGNERFRQNNRIGRDLLEQVKETAAGQFPFAAVVSCIDSRVPTEIVFDLGIGDVFNVRIAGNFINQDILGSLEFACKVAGSKAIIVMGHSSCGAVKGACDMVELGNLTGLLEKIRPAVDAVSESGDRSSKNGGFVQRVAEKNVELSVQNIREHSPLLNEMYEAGEIEIVGAMYDVASGKVVFMDK